MSKKWLVGAMAVAALGSGTGAASAETVSGSAAPSIQYTWNGQAVQPASPAVNIDNRLYLPLRAIGEMTGQYVDYDLFRGKVSLTQKPELTGKYSLKADDLAKGVKMGVGSSLTHVPGDPDNVFYSTADRGPNGEVDVDGKTRRTFPLANYTPSLYKIQIDNDEIKILDTFPLKVNGTDPVTGNAKITGLPNIKGRDEVPYDAEAKNELSYDPYGVDIEGLAYDAKSDTFWISEEYGPSIIQVKRDGTVLQRVVPQGWAAQVDSPAVPVKEAIPASYLKLRQNRGAEALGITPDGKWMFMAMQSPLRNPDKSVDNSRQLRILKFDLETLKPVAEYAYVAEDAADFDGLKQSDIVISDMVAVNENLLLIDERDKNAGDKAQLKRIYATDLTNATNILGQYDDTSKTGKTLEQMTVSDLKAAGILPPSKRTILDSVEFKYPYEKIEGLSLVNGNTLVIINDNDFGVDSDSDSNGTELWTFKLPYTIQ